MKIVAIDTSTKTLCIGVRNGRKEYEYNVDYATRLSQYVAPALARVFRAAEISARDADYFACGIGPGSFTGLRIGMACIKGMAYASGVPVVGVASLDTIALNARKEEGVIASIVDAKRGLVYAAFYMMKKKTLTRVSPYLLVAPAKLEGEIHKRIGKKKLPVVCCGDGIPVIREALADIRQAHFLDSDYWKPQGRHVVELAAQKIARKEFSDAFSIAPLYLYPKECQIRQNP